MSEPQSSAPPPPHQRADDRKHKRTSLRASEPVAGPLTARCRAVVDSLPRQAGRPALILPTLQAVQEAIGYVPDDAVPVVASACNASLAEVFGVLTFYSDLRRTPPSAAEVHVCLGEACQAVGARELLAEAEGLIAQASGASGVDVHRVFCMGNCALGPTAVVNGTLVGRATVGDIRAHVDEALRMSAAGTGGASDGGAR